MGTLPWSPWDLPWSPQGLPWLGVLPKAWLGVWWKTAGSQANSWITNQQQGRRIRVVRVVSRDFLKRQKKVWSSFPRFRRHLFWDMPSFSSSGWVDSNWECCEWLRGLSGGGLTVYTITGRALVVSLGRQGLTDTWICVKSRERKEGKTCKAAFPLHF